MSYSFYQLRPLVARTDEVGFLRRKRLDQQVDAERLGVFSARSEEVGGDLESFLLRQRAAFAAFGRAEHQGLAAEIAAKLEHALQIKARRCTRPFVFEQRQFGPREQQCVKSNRLE